MLDPSPPYLPDPYTIPTTRLRVATLNIYGGHDPWENRRSVLSEGFRALQPGLVALQEVIKTDTADQASEVLGDAYHIVHQTQGKVDANGIAIASRWPITAVHEIDLNVTPRTADFFCSALIAEIQAPEPMGRILFVNHLPSYELAFEHERELQAVVVARFIEQLMVEREMHVILAGDLDADPRAASIRFWTGRQSLGDMSVCYRDAWESSHADAPGHTFTPGNGIMTAWDWPFRRIDYIFVRYGDDGGPSLAVTACARIFDEPVNGVWASDHFGVMADLALPSAREVPLHDT